MCCKRVTPLLLFWLFLSCTIKYHNCFYFYSFLFICLFAVLYWSGTMAINVQCPVKRYVVILFQPVTLKCQYQTSDPNPPLITWKYKSYCKDPIEMAMNPSSSDNAIAQANPNYDPVIECPDNQRTLRIVASKRISTTLGAEYQGRRISIINSE